MSASAAKTHAVNATNTPRVEDKLNYIARAIYELARSIGDIEDDVTRIKNNQR
jgi:hypothetical protein